MDCRFLLQKIFPTEGSNLGPPVLHADSLPAEPQGKPKTDSATPWTNTPGLSVHGDSSGKNAGVGCHALLQGIFPTQGLNPGLLHCRRTLSSETPGKSESCQVVSNSFRPHGILQARILEWVPFPSPGDLPNPGIEPRSLALQADPLPAEPPGMPKNTGVGSLSVLLWIFPTEETNRGLLHCRWVLYQLSY